MRNKGKHKKQHSLYKLSQKLINLYSDAKLIYAEEL